MLAEPDRLRRTLGVEPGSVTPLALANDSAAPVRLALDRGLADGQPLARVGPEAFAGSTAFA